MPVKLGFRSAFLAMVIAWCQPSGAWDDKQVESPEQVASKAMESLKENRLEDFASLMHPAALQRFKEMVLSIVEGAAELGQEKQVLGLFGTV